MELTEESNDRSFHKLDVIEPSVMKNICVDICGSKCCDFILNDHYVPVEIIDYYRLDMLGLEQLSIFDSQNRTLELMNKPDGSCIFLHPEKNHCTIYNFRPRACRNYPFNSLTGKLPDWCELHKQASKKLIEEKVKAVKNRNLKEEGKFEIVPVELSEKFIRLEMGQDPRDYGFTAYNEKITSNEIWFINAVNNKSLDNAEKTIKELIKEHKSKNWFLVNIVHYSDDFKLIFQIQGMFRKNDRVSIPHAAKFPDSYPTYASLQSLYINTKEVRSHLISGASTDEAAYDYLEELVQSEEKLSLLKAMNDHLENIKDD